uniref:Ovule protein n=1 Tax=Steinernema glaseri TaxID=37863 RepID=A0A1I7YZ46_9BILA
MLVLELRDTIPSPSVMQKFVASKCMGLISYCEFARLGITEFEPEEEKNDIQVLGPTSQNKQISSSSWGSLSFKVEGCL